MILTIPFYWFDATSNGFEALEETSSEVADTGRGKKIRCRSCEHIITHESQLIAINGSRVHTRTNPGGYEFQFECFRNAPGCSALGTPTFEHSWFTGYQWQIAVCAGCGEHLGWGFRGENPFYGLISNRLIRDMDNLD